MNRHFSLNSGKAETTVRHVHEISVYCSVAVTAEYLHITVNDEESEELARMLLAESNMDKAQSDW